MKRIFLSVMLLLTLDCLNAQHTIRLIIRNKEESSPLAGATALIQSLKKTAIADSAGMVIFTDVPRGIYLLSLSFVGREEQRITIIVPQDSGTVKEVILQEAEEAGEEVVVTATRTSRSINDMPTRVETISGEELAEKGNMKPGDIRMLLSESTGIQTQQTSATSYNSSIRIQGLDGRYTQILRDGIPLYSGFAGGLSLMQVAPLDLKQIEVIKGSSSTLYGAGAIAGLVNLVSKTPTEKREINLLANITSALGTDLSGFYSQKFQKTGITMFASRNTGRPYDPARIGLTAIPKFARYTLNPRIFLYGRKSNADIGFSYITEDRTGGSMNFIKKGEPGYYERNKTNRFSTQAQYSHQFTGQSQLTIKNSFSRFNRSIEIPAYVFKGLQLSSYTEISYRLKKAKFDWVIGGNFISDDFNEDRNTSVVRRDYHFVTTGLFLQNTWSPHEKFTLETGLRGDYVSHSGFELLPRLSALLKPLPKFTVRIGGGRGYKTPTVFNEESEKIQFRGILPVDQQRVTNERSTGVNVDLNYKTNLGTLRLAVNQLFFYTKLNRPLILAATTPGNYEFVNADGHLDTRGLETNLRFTYKDFKLFVGYTFADVNTHFNNLKSWFPLTARHRLNNVLIYEKEGNIKIGAEAYFFSKQKLHDGTSGRSYWTFGLMGEKVFKNYSVFINFENFTDTRQTKFDKIYSGSIGDPDFKDIYAPLDGVVLNGGVKVRL